MQATGIAPVNTTAAAVFIHGHEAKLVNTDEVSLSVNIQATIKDLDIENTSGLALSVEQAVLERIRIRASGGLQSSGSVTARDISIEVTGYAAISNSGTLILDRGVIVGGTFGIRGGGRVDLTNLLVYGTSDTALDLQNVVGSVSFTTVADSGAASTVGGGIRCPVTANVLTVRSSIFWTSGSHPAATGACSFLSTIAGPMGVIGAMNVNPLFVDAANRNYRLGDASPARDMVDVGPPMDYEGDARPKGPRFDIGADESP